MTLRYARLALLAATFVSVPAAFAQSGRITGRVTDSRTGDELPGVNIQLDGTTVGAVTDVDGYFTIIGVRAGTYRVRASYIGYATRIIENVRVNIDQTTPLSFTLAEEDLEGAETVITAERPVVEADVSGSRANVGAEQIESMPVVSVTGVVGLQAGAEGLSIRGSSTDQVSFNINGLTTRNERDNSNVTTIPLSSVQEVQVVTGGFNAEYGSVRSGLVNVVTKEGDRRRYNVDVSVRASPPADKNFDQSPNDPDSYYIRPFLDPAVAFVGTQRGTWDLYTQQQYPTFEGWISVSERLLANSNPADDMTPQALQDAFLFQHRKSFQITEPDYNFDIGVGGPVPGLNRFGDTRFYGSYRRDQNMYFIPLSRDRHLQQTGHLKVTSDVTGRIKLTVEGLYSDMTATAASRLGQPGIFASTGGIAADLDRVTFTDTRIFASDYWNPTRVQNAMLGTTLRYAPNNTSYMELRLARNASVYDTNPGRARDTTKVAFFGGVGFDEGPFGFVTTPSNGVDGMRMGVGMSTARDSSRVTAYNAKFDYTRQFSRFFEVKTGAEYNVVDSRVNYGQFDAYLRADNFRSVWDRTPTRGALYAQTRAEFAGIIANTGLRLDYSYAGGQWYSYGVYAPQLANVAVLDTLEKADINRIWALSPRLGVSFPITERSKLFVNYGHFRGLPSPDDLFLIRSLSVGGRVLRIADPNAPMPKTIAYELGYEQSFLDQFLVRVTGYYKNVSLEARTVTYNNRAGTVSYTRSEPNNYADTRGFEFSLERRRGDWVRGFFNFTYMVDATGYFGRSILFENPTSQRQQDLATSPRSTTSKPVAQPYARLNLDFFTPSDFGPQVGRLRPLADWHLIALGTWRAGSYATWAGGGAAPLTVRNNVQYRDVTNLNLRIVRDFRFGPRRVQLFVDIDNALNQRRLSLEGFATGNDFTAYMNSLHLPAPQENEYQNLRGNDRPGDFRRPGVEFVPIVAFANRASFQNPDARALYYERSTDSYLSYVNGAWQAADQSRVDQVLRDKAYIDMPNQGFLNFLNPRSAYFGIRLNF